ncbi:efflux RND transporter periplasmic adaptor subunit [Polynucleobacter kasalickyi]|uniref:RND family efflux transporter, MFP subunit n=1 Tax=Polynucleobacter kasalickyi TaxID=1938817 RepID=A0A1W1ZVZ9_9BURK|nr:efflux RND transporter periplasmic adaptor subunit [Polynucleobacter kasalickyi]SMC52238.1 RND family efflux transporter, MFP subunit [Polynucleobacter kasalickyi]
MNNSIKSKFNIKKIGLSVLILAGIGYATYTFFLSSPKEEKKSNQGAQTVVSVKAVKKDFPVIIETSGNIVSANIVDIRPQVTNIISKIHFKDGQDVKAGDILFTLDDRADKANYEKAKALAEDAQRQYQRSVELLKQNFISQATVDTALANANSAQATANAAAVVLSYDTIRSPITGKTGVINVFVGQLVQPGNVVSTTTTSASTTTLGAMVTVTQLNPIYVQFMVPESYMAGLIQLQKASSGLGVKVDIGNGKTKEGKVFVVDNQVDTSIGSVKVKATLDNADNTLAPGRFVNVTLQTQLLKDSIVVPSQSIISNTSGDQVYLVDDENKVSLKKIKILVQTNGYAAISGIDEGARIVVEGKQNLRPGAKVTESTAGKTDDKPKESKEGPAATH